MKKEKVICNVCKAKNTFQVMESCIAIEGEIYPEFCPNPRGIAGNEIYGVIQVCDCCGYTFPRIDEDTNMNKKKIRSECYQYPFGKNYTDSVEAVKCYRIALTAREAGSGRMAIRWFIYAGLLLQQGANQVKCYKNAFVLLKDYMCQPFGKVDIQILLAYLNVMRLLNMFGSVVRIGTYEKRFYMHTDQELIETLILLAQKRNNQYMTYFEMLLLN